MKPKNRRVLRLAAVIEKTGLRSAAIYKWVGLGEFPRPFALTPTLPGKKAAAVGWYEDEIDAYLAKQSSNRISPKQPAQSPA